MNRLSKQSGRRFPEEGDVGANVHVDCHTVENAPFPSRDLRMIPNPASCAFSFAGGGTAVLCIIGGGGFFVGGGNGGGVGGGVGCGGVGDVGGGGGSKFSAVG